MSEYKLVPVEPTPEMVEAAEDAYMPFGDMDLAIRMAVLAASDGCTCHGCKKLYALDVSVSDTVWASIYTEDKDKAAGGGGMLCPQCIVDRLQSRMAILAAPVVQGEPVYFWREIGESDWMECGKDWYWKCADSPEHDTKLLYTAPKQPAEQQPDVSQLAEALERQNKQPVERNKP